MICQIQISNKKYDYSHPQRLNKYYQPLSQPNEHAKLSVMSTDTCLPASQSSIDDLSHNLLRQVTLKNQLLNAQIAQYKLLLQKLQQRIEDLLSQNQQLHNKIEQKKQDKSRQHSFGKPSKREEILSQQSSVQLQQSIGSEYIFTLKQIDMILTPFSEISTNLPKTKDWPSKSKNQMQIELFRMLNERQEMEALVESIWEMKDQIQPGPQDLLSDLWKWLKQLGATYHQLLDYRRMQSKSRQQQTKKGLLS